MDDAEDDLDLVSLLLWGAGLLLLYQATRFASLAPGGFAFGPAAPNTIFGGAVDNVIPNTLSPEGRQFIKDEEKFSAYPYQDGNGQSVAWGHQIKAGEAFTYPLSFDQGEQLFDSDTAGVESTLNSTVTVPVSQNQFDALGDLVFDIGATKWRTSTLLKKLNAGDYAGAAAEFERWNKSKGQVVQALKDRRTKEVQLFNQAGA